jgi:hypothetical protein
MRLYQSLGNSGYTDDVDVNQYVKDYTSADSETGILGPTKFYQCTNTPSL